MANRVVKKKKKITKLQREKHRDKRQIKAMYIAIIALGVFLTVGAYAWFSTTTNVKIKTFNMVVTKNSGLSISFDGVEYFTSLEISREIIIEDLAKTYPNNNNQWAQNGLIPVSSAGISNPNSYLFDMYASAGGVLYKNKNKDVGYVNIVKIDEDQPRNYNSYVAFDMFIKNETDSPVADNLYFDNATRITFEKPASEEMIGLLNSLRIGIVKVGSLPLKSSAKSVQDIKCDNNCESVIYEPYENNHTELSIERAKKYGIHLENGRYFPTYAYINEGEWFKVAETISGAYNMDFRYFKEQKNIFEDNFDDPLFTIPNGITKVRVYVWIEGQDIDSLETNSDGAELAISINFVKDTHGTSIFN